MRAYWARVEADTAARRDLAAFLVAQLSGEDNHTMTLALRDALPGDRYLLCADGLHAVVSEDDIRDVLVAEPDPERATGRLVEPANGNGGPDNVACVVADVTTG